MRKLVLATGNAGKLVEIQTRLSALPVEVVSQGEFKIEDAVEDGLSFVENAIIKARHAAKLTGLPSLADDSGLEVDALMGAPGIYSARYAGAQASNENSRIKLLGVMKNQSNRSARFRCVMAYMRHAKDPCPIITSGSWEGLIAETEAGSAGFGYDPLFFVPTDQCTAAQLSADRKNELSHRGIALRAMREQLLKKIETH